MLYVMLYGRYPFPGPEGPALSAQIKACAWVMPPGISEMCQGLLRGLLEKDPSARMGTAEIESHPWFLAGLPPGAPSGEPEGVAAPGASLGALPGACQCQEVQGLNRSPP